MKKTKKPVMSDKEMIQAVSDRTSVPFNTVFAIIAAYQDIIKLCIKKGVEVKMGDFCVMGWRIKPPHKGVVYYNPQTGENMDPIDVPGFWVPSCRFRKNWRSEIRSLTEYWEDEGSDKDAL